jgi:hypothetical protein
MMRLREEAAIGRIDRGEWQSARRKKAARRTALV